MSVTLYNFNNLSNLTIRTIEELFAISSTLKEEFTNFKNPKTKTIIYMNGIAGSGKSKVCKKINDYLNVNFKKCYVLSKDDFRYTDKGYIFEKEYEVVVSKNYKDKLKKLVTNDKYNIIILDNTHINYEKILETRDCYKDVNCNELIVSIEPFKDVTKHINLNIHEVPKEGIIYQIKQWKEHKEKIRSLNIKTLYLDHENDNFIQEKQINIICNIFNHIL